MFNRVALVAFVAVFVQGTHALGQAHFKRFPETVTNDGAYVLAWGLKDDEDGDVASKTEIPADGAEHINIGEIEFSTFENVEDYLVDTARGKIIATIPGFTYFAGSEGRENHFNLEVGWSPDDRGGLAIYEGRYQTDKIAWINPIDHKARDVTSQIEKPLRRVAMAKKGKRASDDELSVSTPVFLRPRRMVVAVTMGELSSKRENAVSYDFDVIFDVKGSLGAPQFEVVTVKWKSNNDETESAGNNDNEETQLNKIYRKLSAALSPKEREDLKQEQLKWLATREHFTAAQQEEKEFNQLQFTRRRIAELETRFRFR